MYSSNQLTGEVGIETKLKFVSTGISIGLPPVVLLYKKTYSEGAGRARSLAQRGITANID